jgi:hypothetical protein
VKTASVEASRAEPDDAEPEDTESEDDVEPKPPRARGEARRRPKRKTVVEPVEPPAPHRRNTRFAVAAVLAVVFALVAVVMTAVTVRLNDQVDGDRSERGELARLAGDFTEALVGYDFQTFENAGGRVRALAGEPFLSQYEAAFPDLAQQVAEQQVRASVTIKDVFVSDVEGGAASAIVATDRTVTSAQGAHQENNVYVRLDLARIDGEWKVVGVTNLNLALSQTPLDDVVGSEPGGTPASTPTSTP